MSIYKLGVVAACLLSANGVAAEVVRSSVLGDLSGSFNAGTVTATTTANSHGTSSTVTGPSGGANRVSVAPAPVGRWYQSDVGGGATVGITDTYQKGANGSAYFNTVGAASKADLRYTFANPVALSSLTSMSYDVYRDGISSTLNAQIVPTMRLELTNHGVFAGSLILEFFYQGQSNPATDVWNHVSGTQVSGIYWTTNTALGTTFAGAPDGQQTLAQWIASKPGNNYEVTGLTIGAGSGWPDGFTGAIDNVQFAFAGGPSASFDFAVVPEPAAWALMIAGFGMVGVAARRRRTVVAA